MFNKFKKQSESRVSYMYIGRIVLYGERWIYKYLNLKVLFLFSLGNLLMQGLVLNYMVLNYYLIDNQVIDVFFFKLGICFEGLVWFR